MSGSPVRPRLLVLPDADGVARAAAGEIARVLASAVGARGVADWATTGGSAAPGIYRALGEPPLRDAVDWPRIRTWWGDDRFVPPDHPLSNVLPIAALGLPPETLHPIPSGEAIARGEGPAWAAERYARELRAFVPPGSDGIPVLDLVILGVGPDGHVLSVFPGSAAWDDPRLCVPVPAPSHVEPHVERVTMHPRILAAARCVLVVSSGAAKAAVLARAWAGEDARELPVRATFLPSATWILDEAAAAELPRE